MKNIVLLLALSLSGCVFEARNNELIGQVKKVKNSTPILCPKRVDVDISLGIIRNGIGSMSSEDTWATVSNPEHIEILKNANENGSLVKITYDTYRLTFCQERINVTNVELVK